MKIQRFRISKASKVPFPSPSSSGSSQWGVLPVASRLSERRTSSHGPMGPAMDPTRKVAYFMETSWKYHGIYTVIWHIWDVMSYLISDSYVISHRYSRHVHSKYPSTIPYSNMMFGLSWPSTIYHRTWPWHISQISDNSLLYIPLYTHRYPIQKIHMLNSFNR